MLIFIFYFQFLYLTLKTKPSYLSQYFKITLMFIVITIYDNFEGSKMILDYTHRDAAFNVELFQFREYLMNIFFVFTLA